MSKWTFLQWTWEGKLIQESWQSGTSLTDVTSPPNPPTLSHTQKHTNAHTKFVLRSRWRERERETQTDVPRRMSEGREREREQCVPGTPRSPNTTTVSPRSIQWRSNEHNRDRPKPENILYTPHVRVFFFTPISPPPITGDGHLKERREIRTNRRGRKEEGKKERRRRTWGRISFFHGIFPGTRLPFSGCKTERRKRNSTSLYAEKNKGQTEFESDCKMVIR